LRGNCHRWIYRIRCSSCASLKNHFDLLAFGLEPVELLELFLFSKEDDIFLLLFILFSYSSHDDLEDHRVHQTALHVFLENQLLLSLFLPIVSLLGSFFNQSVGLLRDEGFNDLSEENELYGFVDALLNERTKEGLGEVGQEGGLDHVLC